MNYFTTRIIAPATLLVLATACSNVLGSSGSGEVELRIRQSIAPLTHTSAELVASAADAGSIDPADVTSLLITITDVQFLPVGEDSTDNGGWQTLTLSAAVDLDLAALPGPGSSPITIAAGTLDIGDYRKVRLMTDQGTIEFAVDISVGQATLAAATAHPVTIPSGAQTGIKTDIAFSVSDDGAGGAAAVDLVFDPSATFGNVTVTGNGAVKLAPVMRAATP